MCIISICDALIAALYIAGILYCLTGNSLSRNSRRNKLNSTSKHVVDKAARTRVGLSNFEVIRDLGEGGKVGFTFSLLDCLQTFFSFIITINFIQLMEGSSSSRK